MRTRTLVANVLLPAAIALVIVAIWFWTTGGTPRSALTVVGLALVSAGASVAVEWLIAQARRTWRRRSRPPRHRKPAV
ncbi:hypothetical protein F3K34_43905 [Streptomyces sp. LBUM 1486]|uniref:hypothetical protein n=1 Tax=Streptomyces scabiei TaxID=1930 RepID=UPI001B330082|nr:MULTISPECIES: hypothetical protein [Streptomyces]MBP5918733.1 hypothetical protein [Streptomyces sp. LBUM 1486]MDX3283067.1 hypothetical protein [Streptomyces scabiei]